MKKSKEVINKKISGDMAFLGSDALMARMQMEQKEEIMSKRVIDFAPIVLPSDYEKEKYDVSGKFSFELEIKEK